MSQGFPYWSGERASFVKAYLSNSNDISAAYTDENPPGGNSSIPPLAAQGGRTNEDCLFLDVIVPKSVYDTASLANSSGGAPIFFWTFGGEFYEGDISSHGSPAGLIARSLADPETSPGIIYVGLKLSIECARLVGWLAQRSQPVVVHPMLVSMTKGLP